MHGEGGWAVVKVVTRWAISALVWRGQIAGLICANRLRPFPFIREGLGKGAAHEMCRGLQMLSGGLRSVRFPCLVHIGALSRLGSAFDHECSPY
jgi:hypothetical protein